MASRRSSPTTLPVAIAMAVVLAVVDGGLCPARCRCDDDNLRASCAHAGLDIVPIQLNPGIKHLDLSNNRIGSLGMAFGFYSNMESLDLNSNVIPTLGSGEFDFQQNLIRLNISDNVIGTISKKAFHGLTALKRLDLSGNNITDMEPQTFRHTSELEELNLSGNSITSLPEGLLKYLHRIRTLLMSRNSLLEVPNENLAVAPSLENVDLSDNLIQELGRESLPSLPSLVTLNLANNVIRSIADGAFDRLPSLLTLDLSRNNLTIVPTPALARLSVLTTLIMNSNPLNALESAAFRDLFELRTLELSNCKIERIDGRAFADNVNLERISLDGNRELGELPARVLYGARYLKHVSLRRCSLTTLQPTHFPVDNLFTLRIGGNPLICNCSVHWLWNVIRAEEHRNESRLELDSQDIICTDEEFSGKPLIMLTESSLRCKLSPLYLALFVIGCLAATAMILALIAHLTRAKRKKRLTYTAPNRPEFLVYVGRSNGELDKNTESYSRRLLTRQEETPYESPRAKAPERSPPETNIYETPKFALPGQDHRYGLPADPADHDGVYAVADVTNLRREPPEVLSLYRMQNPSRTNSTRIDCGYEYDYEYEYEPPVPEKPHVVFV